MSQPLLEIHIKINLSANKLSTFLSLAQKLLDWCSKSSFASHWLCDEKLQQHTESSFLFITLKASTHTSRRRQKHTRRITPRKQTARLKSLLNSLKLEHACVFDAAYAQFIFIYAERDPWCAMQSRFSPLSRISLGLNLRRL